MGLVFSHAKGAVDHNVGVRRCAVFCFLLVRKSWKFCSTHCACC